MIYYAAVRPIEVEQSEQLPLMLEFQRQLN